MGVQSLHPQLNLPVRHGNGDLELEGNRNQAEETPQPRGHNAHRRRAGLKHIRHPVLGPIAFEYSAFAVDGRPDLSMVVYNPTTPADRDKIGSMIGSVPALEHT